MSLELWECTGPTHPELRPSFVKAMTVFCSQFSLFFSDSGISSAITHSGLFTSDWVVTLSLCHPQQAGAHPQLHNSILT